jgi:hypothetical protein
MEGIWSTWLIPGNFGGEGVRVGEGEPGVEGCEVWGQVGIFKNKPLDLEGLELGWEFGLGLNWIGLDWTGSNWFVLGEVRKGSWAASDKLWDLLNKFNSSSTKESKIWKKGL